MTDLTPQGLAPAADDPAPTAEPAQMEADAPPRRRDIDPVFWVLLLIAVMPVLATILAMTGRGWLPTADDAWVARRTAQVVSADPPLVGQDSTAKADLDGPLLHHPGPIAYIINAVPYAATGWAPVGLLVGVGLVAIAAVASSMWLSLRVWNMTGAWCCALALVMVMVRLTPNALVRPTSSVTLVLPLFAMLIGLSAYVAGDRGGAIVAVLFANYCLQTSLVMLPFVVIAMIGLAVLAAFRIGAGFRPGRGALITAVAVVVTWIPPLIQQFTSSSGNLTNIIHYVSGGSAEAHSARLGIVPAGRAFAGYIVAPPWTHQLVEPSPHLPQGSLWLLVALLAVVGAAAWKLRCGEASLPGLVGIAALAVAAGAFTFSKRPFPFLVNPVYMVVWIQGIAGFCWFVAMLVVVTGLRERLSAAGAWDRAKRPLTIAGMVVLVALAGSVLLYRPSEGSSLSDAYRGSAVIRELRAQVNEQVQPSDVNVVGRGLANNELAKGLGVDLHRDGFRARYTELTPMSDERQVAYDRTLPTLLITGVDDPPGSDAQEISRFDNMEGDPVVLWLAPPEDPQDG